MSRRAVAISTTGHPHRMRFLETCVRNWDMALRGTADSLFVTVDGSVEDTKRVADLLVDYTGSVFQVGLRVQHDPLGMNPQFPNRRGVAANKNTGLELMMDNTNAEHLFLSDDDCWPLYSASLDKHVAMPYAHSMVCWGRKRLHASSGSAYAVWSWPRGVMLYVNRAVVEAVGGMDERFGAGGHEHAEYSQRIHNAGFIPTPFLSPASYATRNAMGAGVLWHCEDMPKYGESAVNFASRKQAQTTIVRGGKDWDRIHAVMAEREGSSDFVGFRASDNGRAWATLFSDLPSQGAEGHA